LRSSSSKRTMPSMKVASTTCGSTLSIARFPARGAGSPHGYSSAAGSK
jgi:hypothetical protein